MKKGRFTLNKRKEEYKVFLKLHAVYGNIYFYNPHER